MQLDYPQLKKKRIFLKKQSADYRQEITILKVKFWKSSDLEKSGK